MSTVISDDEVKANISVNLRRFMDDRGWTQEELARRSGEPLRNIGRLSRGENVSRVGAVARCAEALGVTIDRLTSAPPSAPPEKNSRRSA